MMPDREKIVAQCEWAIKQTSPTIIESKTFYEEVLALMKEQEAKPVEVCGKLFTVKYGHCPTCGKGMDSDTYPNWCGFCGQAVKWE